MGSARDLQQLLFEYEKLFCHNFQETQDWDSSFVPNGSFNNSNTSESISMTNQLWSSPVTIPMTESNFTHGGQWLLLDDIDEMPADAFCELSQIVNGPPNTDESFARPAKNLPFLPNYNITEPQLPVAHHVHVCPTPQNPASLATTAAHDGGNSKQITQDDVDFNSILSSDVKSSGQITLDELGKFIDSTVLDNKGKRKLKNDDGSSSGPEEEVTLKVPKLVKKVIKIRLPGSPNSKRDSYVTIEKFHTQKVSGPPPQAQTEQKDTLDQTAAFRQFVLSFSSDSSKDNENDEPKNDLRSRKLCLVPRALK